jgi:magnesium transporter
LDSFCGVNRDYLTDREIKMDAIYYHNSVIQPIANQDVPTFLAKKEGVLWVDLDVSTPEDAVVLESLFHFHPLAIEDVMHRHQRPKADEYENYLFFILNPIADLNAKNIFRELDIFVGKHFIVTAHHGTEPTITAARHRLGVFHVPFENLATYLLYVLIDTLVDAYLPILEQIEKKIDSLSEKALEDPRRDLLQQISYLKSNLNEIWWVIFPQQEIITFLMQHDEYFVDEKSRYYLRDVSDHLGRILNATQAARETMNGLISIYMGAVSNRLNIAVNRLTIFTLLIGVNSVIVGFYGMNFLTTWPPFEDPRGVPIVIGLMVVIIIVMIALMRWQRWIE